MPSFPSFSFSRNTGVQNSLPPYLSGFQDYSQLGQPGMAIGMSPFQRPPSEPSFVMGQPQAGRDAMTSFMQNWGPSSGRLKNFGQPQSGRDAMVQFMQNWGPNRTRVGLQQPNAGQTTNIPYPNFSPIPLPQANPVGGGIPFDDVGLLRQWQQQRGVQVLPRY